MTGPSIAIENHGVCPEAPTIAPGAFTSLIGGGSMAGAASLALGEAFLARFMRCQIPRSGKLEAMAVLLGALAEGEDKIAIYDNGEAAEGKYTKLYESPSGKQSTPGALGWETFAPELPVTAGQLITVGVMNNGILGEYQTTPATKATTLPGNFANGVNAPKLVASHKFAEFKFAATLTEAGMEALNGPGFVLAGLVT